MRKLLLDNRYEIHTPLGEGVMGTVYRGVDLETGQDVAIKHLKMALIQEYPEMLARFERESQILRQLDHPNIVKLLATIQEDKQHYLIMEYMPGGTLSERQQHIPQMSIDDILEIALDLTDALTRAHRLGIIHRDLKPANVLLAADGTPRLSDFGHAHVSSSNLTEAGVVLGTLAYVSPEACQGLPLDPRSDIWSFGVMLFEMIAGRVPFTGDDVASIITAVLTQAPPDLEEQRPDAPPALVDLVYRMLTKDPGLRVPRMRIIGAELEGIIQGNHPATVTSRTSADSPGPQQTLGSEHHAAKRHNLPVQLTPFIGRNNELAALGTMLDDPSVRLVTILGHGGMGKTRLSLEAGAVMLDHFVDGVFFVPLATLNTASQIVSAIAEATDFHFHQGTNPQEQLLTYLRTKQILIILDNFEHLVDDALLLGKILRAAPAIRLLVTSRERLRLSLESIFMLHGLKIASGDDPENVFDADAIRLFIQHAKTVSPRFDPDDVAPIVRICQLVEGMPLGIILAAAWADLLTPEEIATEISQNLDLLETDLQDIPARQRSIRAVFDYAWRQLSGTEREVIARLAVFRAGFTREAAQAVAHASLQDLMVLTNKSILRRSHETGRFDIHELLRQYAASHLTDEQRYAIQTAHLEYYAGWMRHIQPALIGRRPAPQQASIQPLTDPLSAREQEVLRMLALGLSNRDIAEQLVIAISTVKSHTNRIFSKLDVQNRTQALIKARSLGIID